MTTTTRAAGPLAASLLPAVALAAQRPTDIVKWSAKLVQTEVVVNVHQYVTVCLRMSRHDL
jgi:hypothetical protein